MRNGSHRRVGLARAVLATVIGTNVFAGGQDQSPAVRQKTCTAITC